MLVICIPFTVIAILYNIFVLKEVEPKKTDETKNGIDNPGFDNVTNDASEQVNEINNGHHATESNPKEKRNCLVDFFNPIVIVQCVQVIIRKRENRGRIVLWILFFIFFLSITSNAESQLEFLFVRAALSWDAGLHSTYRSYSLLLGIIASFMLVSVLGKKFKFPDPILAVIGIIFSIIAKCIYVSKISMNFRISSFNIFD